MLQAGAAAGRLRNRWSSIEKHGSGENLPAKTHRYAWLIGIEKATHHN
jgi:hypothetical protein